MHPILRQPQSTTRRNLRLSTRDGAWYCIMLGFGEANIVLFGSLVGLRDIWLALLAGVPPVLGAALALLTPRLVQSHHSHKRWMVRSALVQGSAFAVLALAALFGRLPAAALFAVAIIYWAANLSCGATWNTLISTLVPPRIRARYFSRRSPALNLAQVAAVFLGGWILQLKSSPADALLIIAALFFIAFLARSCSAYNLALHTELEPIPTGYRIVGTRELIGRFAAGAGGRVLVYRLAVQTALNASTPFVIPYLLFHKGLQSDYIMFGILTGVLTLAKAVAVPLWGRIAHEHGPRALLRIGGLAIIPTPALWLLSDDTLYIVAIQILAGFSLAAYELATLLVLFETVAENERTSVLAKFNLADNAAVAVGSLIGAFSLNILARLDSEIAPRIADLVPLFGSAPSYAWVFLVATLLRLLTLPLLGRIPRPQMASRTLAEATLELHPLPGAADAPMIATHHGDGERPAARPTQRSDPNSR